MQYISQCWQHDCDFYWQGPDESNTWVKLIDHIEETGHVGSHSGVYDTPPCAGVWGPTEDGESYRELSQDEEKSVAYEQDAKEWKANR